MSAAARASATNICVREGPGGGLTAMFPVRERGSSPTRGTSLAPTGIAFSSSSTAAETAVGCEVFCGEPSSATTLFEVGMR